MKGGHKVGERPRHLELYLDGLGGEDQGVLVREWNEPEKPGGLGRAPLPGGTVGQGNHHCLQLGADNLEFADGLELHGLAGKVLLWGDRVGEDVEEELGGAGGVHSERHSVAHHRLGKGENI